MTEKPSYEELERRVQELEKIVSEHKYSKESLRESENLFKRLYEKAPLGYQSLDENGHFMVVNQTWLDNLGYKKEEVIGKSFANFLHPDWRDHFNENFPRFKAIGEILGVEFEMVKKNGDLILVSFTGKISRDKKGDFQQTHCIFHDITERKQAEDALRQNEKALYESEERLRLFIEHAPASLAMFDCDMHYLIASRRWLQDYELGDHDLTGLTLGEIDNIPKRCKEALHRGLAGEVLREEEERYERPDGSVWWVRWEIRPWPTMSAAIGGIIVFTENITERKQAEAQLQSLNDELEQIVERRSRELEEAQSQYLHAVKLSAIGQLTASIAHEFNNPLQGLRAILKGLKRRAIMEEEDKELLDLAISENERLKKLIKSLQEFNRPSAGEKMAMDVHAALDSLLLLYKSDFKRKGISTVRKYAEGFPSITVIPDQLKQVFLNLLNNATEACSEKGGVITITTCHDNQKVVIAIQDTGVGFENNMKNNIFEPFFTTKTKEKGTGLGLSICRDIIQHHQGGIRVESQPGKGTTFTILLPAI